MFLNFIKKILLLKLLLIQPTLNEYSENNSQIYSNYLNNFINDYGNLFKLNKFQDEMLKPLENNQITNDNNLTYDFIIVGSGSAGSIIANRLSENPEWNILLLEAGKGENLFSQVPILAPILQFTHYNWNHYMEYQPNVALGLNNHRMHWPRGKALGGTTVINYMIYTRGNRLDFDRWAAAGNPGWSYEEVLPYFMKSENSTLRNADYNYHGTSGYISTQDIYQSRLVDLFIKSGNELNLPFIDYNAPTTPFGFSTVQANCQNGQRHSVAKAFLSPIKRIRKNLHILTSAYVTKLLIDPTKKSVYGVEYDRKGQIYQAYANKEVILSAGSYNSPQLLMLAGIGPKNDLENLGIEVIQDLPVGKYMEDHLTFPGLVFTINETLSISFDRLLGSIYEYKLNGTGPLTNLGGVEGLGYIKTNQSSEIVDLPDVELIFIDGSLVTDLGLFTRRGMNIRDEVYDSLLKPIENLPQFSVFPMPLHPKSVGYIKLRSKNPYDYPLLYGNYFTDPNNDDIKTFIAAIRFIQKMAQTQTFQSVGAKMNPNRIPGCKTIEFDSDEYWECAVRNIAVTLHHQVGTCKMGPEDDSTAIVNNELKVYGINGLRVADCSIIPFAVGAHTSAPAMMVGEKAADLIKKSWGFI